MAKGLKFGIYVQPYQSYTETRPAITFDEYSYSSDTETAYKQLDDIHSYGKSKFIQFSVAQPYGGGSMFPSEQVPIEAIDTTTVTQVENMQISLGERLTIGSTGVQLLASDPATGFTVEGIYIKNKGSTNIAHMSVDAEGRYDIELNPGQAFFSRLYGTVEGQIYAKTKTGGTTTGIEYILFKRS